MAELLSSRQRVFNANKGQEERIAQIYVMRGKEQIAVASIKPGDIGAVAKLPNTSTGDTLCDKAIRSRSHQQHTPTR